MAIGLKYGKGLNDDNNKKQISYNQANSFISEFQKLNNSVQCRELLNGLNMNDPDDYRIIEEQELFRTHCAKYVRQAVEITEKLIG